MIAATSGAEFGVAVDGLSAELSSRRKQAEQAYGDGMHEEPGKKPMHEASLELFDRAVELSHPRPGLPLMGKARALIGLRRDEEAEQAAYAAAAAFGADSQAGARVLQALNLRGKALQRLGSSRLEDALEAYSGAIAATVVTPALREAAGAAAELVESASERGSVLLKLERYEESAAAYDEALAMTRQQRKGAAEAHAAGGTGRGRGRHTASAAEQQAVVSAGDIAQMYFHQSVALERGGALGASDEALRRSFRLNPALSSTLAKIHKRRLAAKEALKAAAAKERLERCRAVAASEEVAAALWSARLLPKVGSGSGRLSNAYALGSASSSASKEEKAEADDAVARALAHALSSTAAAEGGEIGEANGTPLVEVSLGGGNPGASDGALSDLLWSAAGCASLAKLDIGLSREECGPLAGRAWDAVALESDGLVIGPL